MMFRTFALLVCLVASSASAWTIPTDRRNVMNTIASTAAAVVVASPSVANAIEACPPKSQNCVRATWSPPSGSTSKKEAAKAVREALNSYPQEGQANVDGGGYTIVEDDLDSSGTARIEYRSSGKGNFAKFFNGGKPFVDDLQIEIEDDGKVELRSASRVGESDFGVNRAVSIQSHMRYIHCSVISHVLNCISLSYSASTSCQTPSRRLVGMLLRKENMLAS